VAEVADDRVHRAQHRRRGAEAAVHRQIEEFGRQLALADVELDRGVAHITRLRLEILARSLESFWVGALEAEDRLLVVAHREQGAVAPHRPGAGEEFLAQRADDAPLGGVGVLGFVDEDVVGSLVEFVADPFTHARPPKQTLGPADEVVEIDHPSRPLRRRIGLGETLPRPEPRGEAGDERSRPPHRQQPAAAIEGGGGEMGIILVRRRLALAEAAHLPVASRPDHVELVEQPRPLRRCRLGPLLAQRGALEAVLRAPAAVQ
jgi:hypothetical protein